MEESTRALETLYRRWGWVFALGVLMIATGLLAISSAFVATVVSVILIATFLIISAVAHIVMAFSSRGWQGVVLHLLVGVLAGVLGLMLFSAPEMGAKVLTLWLAAWFIAEGAMRIVGSLVVRFSQWGWSVLNGVVTLVLGLLLFAQWPLSGTWFLGIYLGVDFVMNGASWIALALWLRRVGGARPATLEPRPVT